MNARQHKMEQQIKRERRYLHDLSPHSDCRIFAAPLDHEIDLLASDIQSRGLQHPIEITPDGVIIAGRRRWLALRQLGHESTICNVRHDLAALGEHAIVEHVVKDNTMRRHPTDMEVVRGHYAVELDHTHCRELAEESCRNVVAKLLNKRGNELTDLCRVATTPRVIHDAVDSGAICLADAAKVALMPVSAQDSIAAEISYGEPPDEVMQRYCGRSAKSAVDNVWAASSSALQRTAADLAGCAADLLACDSSANCLGPANRQMIASVVRRLTALLRQA